jgi:hypothetical protein
MTLPLAQVTPADCACHRRANRALQLGRVDRRDFVSTVRSMLSASSPKEPS